MEELDIPKRPEATVTKIEAAHDVERLPSLHQTALGTSCKHPRLGVDAKTRGVSCQDCDAVVDPVDALLKLAERWDRYRGSILSHRKEIGRLQKQLDDLKRQVKNAKAQLRRTTP